MASPLGELLKERVGSKFEFGGYEISRAFSQSEEEEAYALRHRVFLEEGFLDPRAFPKGQFRDRFDEVSVHILVRDCEGQLVGTTRFVRYSLLGFPTEHLFRFAPPRVDRRQLGEYGRLAIDREHRGGSRAPMLGMLKGVFECMIEDKTTHVFAFLSPELASSYASLGCVSVPLDEMKPTADILRNREPMMGYFTTQKVIPVLFSLKSMMIEIGVPCGRREMEYAGKWELQRRPMMERRPTQPALAMGRAT